MSDAVIHPNFASGAVTQINRLYAQLRAEQDHCLQALFRAIGCLEVLAATTGDDRIAALVFAYEDAVGEFRKVMMMMPPDRDRLRRLQERIEQLASATATLQTQPTAPQLDTT